MIQIALLGPVDVRRAGQVVRGFESRKALALLGYLALTGQPQRREHLADLLWGDLPTARALGNLSRVLHNLTHLLPDVWSVDRWTIGLEAGPGCWLDAERFRALAALPQPDAWLEAASLVRGELMADLAIDACPELERWLAVERRAWHERVIELLERLVRHLRAQGRRDDALGWARRLVRQDPWREEGQRALMALLAETGQRAAALAQFEQCRQALADELGVEPAGETVALYERIRRGELSAHDASPPEAPRPPDNLPLPLTSFVGRDAELGLALERLDDPACRLLTLVGPGGAGKSRIAIEVARRAAQRFPDGCWFVRLSGVREPGRVPAAIAAAIGCALDGPEEPVTQLMRHLAARQSLLILDNVEHVLPAGEHVLAILTHAPRVKAIVTSRDRLGYQSEWLLPVAGLPVGEPGDVADASGTDAVRLFVERARQVAPAFAVDAASMAHVVAICRLLEGLPLAIELAAAHAGDAGIAAIERAVRTNLDALDVDLRDVPGRHRSLRAVFDHSWALLDAPERSRLARLTVFHGGFDAASALAVAGADDGALEALERHSLVVREGDGRRLLHEQVRQFAFEILGAAAEDVQGRHARHFLALAQEAEPRLAGPEQAAWLDRLARDHHNLRAALDWLERRSLPDAMRLAAALWRFWLYRGDWAEGIQHTESLLRAAAGHPPSREHALVHNVAGILASASGDGPRARERLEQALAIWRALDSPADIANALNNLGVIADEEGDVERALGRYEESLAIRRRLDRPLDVAVSLNNLAVLYSRQGDLGRARALLEESLAIKRAHGDQRGIAMTLANLGEAASAAGDASAAFACLGEGIRLCWALQDLPDLAEQLAQLARACVVAAADTAALTLAGAHEALRARLGAPIAPADRPPYDAALAKARARLTPEAGAAAFAAGTAMAPGEAVAFALSIPS